MVKTFVHIDWWTKPSIACLEMVPRTVRTVSRLSTGLFSLCNALLLRTCAAITIFRFSVLCLSKQPDIRINLYAPNESFGCIAGFSLVVHLMWCVFYKGCEHDLRPICIIFPKKMCASLLSSITTSAVVPYVQQTFRLSVCLVRRNEDGLKLFIKVAFGKKVCALSVSSWFGSDSTGAVPSRPRVGLLCIWLEHVYGSWWHLKDIDYYSSRFCYHYFKWLPHTLASVMERSVV